MGLRESTLKRGAIFGTHQHGRQLNLLECLLSTFFIVLTPQFVVEAIERGLPVSKQAEEDEHGCFNPLKDAI